MILWKKNLPFVIGVKQLTIQPGLRVQISKQIPMSNEILDFSKANTFGWDGAEVSWTNRANPFYQLNIKILLKSEQ